MILQVLVYRTVIGPCELVLRSNVNEPNSEFSVLNLCAFVVLMRATLTETTTDSGISFPLVRRLL